MQSINKLRSTALVVLLLLQHQVQARSANLTVTFSPDSRSNCATTNDTSQGITFSTIGIAAQTIQCFNLDDLFTSGNTTGSRNLTTSFPNPPLILSWILRDNSNFNPGANFSRVWYQQTNEGNVESALGQVGDGARQTLRVYNGRDCSTIGDPVQPSYGWNCVTDELGACDTVPYKVQSFAISKGPGKDGQCSIPTAKGAGDLSGIGQRRMGIISAGVAILVAAMLML